MAKLWLQNLTATLQRSKPVIKETPLNPFIKVLTLEENVLSLSRLQPHQELSIFDVPINYQGKQFLHTIKCASQHENSENLVLIHGYSGSSALFYPIIKDLSARFNVYCVDLLGMGLSSRPNFPCKSTQETINYFIDSLEEWRKALNLERIFLGGHSLGGYLTTFYALKYPSVLDGLYLFSPTGLSTGKKEQELRQWGPKMTRGQIIFWSLYFDGYSTLIWKDKLTPMELIRNNPGLGKFVIRTYMSALYGNKRYQAGIVSDFLFEMLSLEGGSEQAIHYLLRPPYMDAHVPLESALMRTLSLPIHCFYGEQDWVDWTGAHQISQDVGMNHFKFHWIPHAGHQIIIQNPKGLTHAILH